MSIIESHWRQRQSRTEDGIYFGSDEVIELCGSPSEGYRADIRASVATLLHAGPNGWTDLDEICSAEADDFQVFAGSTSWEGAGFIAVEQRSTGHLLWLLHVSEGGPFTAISFDGSTIQAISEDHSIRFEWHIAIDGPESFTVSP
ncbi:MAG TPA: hypothetical protein VF585_10030 [Chthoniobacterales bacterium]|jgi:hypothetical protein